MQDQIGGPSLNRHSSNVKDYLYLHMSPKKHGLK